MNFEDEFVAHCKIDFFDLAIIKKYGSKSRVVDFSGIEIAVVKLTIDKSDTYKIAIGKIAIVESAGFKFFEMECFLTVVDVMVVLVKEILGHFFKLEVGSGEREVRLQKAEFRRQKSKI